MTINLNDEIGLALPGAKGKRFTLDGKAFHFAARPPSTILADMLGMAEQWGDALNDASAEGIEAAIKDVVAAASQLVHKADQARFSKHLYDNGIANPSICIPLLQKMVSVASDPLGEAAPEAKPPKKPAKSAKKQ